MAQLGVPPADQHKVRRLFQTARSVRLRGLLQFVAIAVTIEV
jgi:hypothetical protein